MDTADNNTKIAAGENNVAGIAKLARTLAHSINGSLSVARGNLMLLRGSLHDPEAQVLLDEAVKALGKQELLARGLSAIAHWDDYRRREVNLQEFFSQRKDRVVHFLGDMELEISPCDRFTVWVDPDYLELAVNALIINAREATAGLSKPKMLIKASSLRPGMAAVEVRDNGVGIGMQKTWSLFEAGFTSKAGGHSGSGLWFVREFAKAAGGNAWAESPIASDGYCGLKIVLTLQTVGKLDEA